MKKRYVIIGLLAASLTSMGQRLDSAYKKQVLSKTDVQVLFSFYTQDNDHSAVTGGIGTENLQVYSPQFFINHQRDSFNTVHIDGGVDIISSASTDNIDFVVSSASKVDARGHTNIGYSRLLHDKQNRVGGNLMYSIESDYTSRGAGLNWSKTSADQSRALSANAQVFFDDLRWGRFENGKPIKLIYPEELRTKEWFDSHQRNSFNFSFGLYQTLNKRMALGIYPGVSYQTGELATPFHRVYFTDDSERVENLPGSRMKIPLGIQLNSFIGSRWILRSYYRFYWDDFGIEAHTLAVESPIKATRVLTFTPFVRLYSQTKANYFKPYKLHDINQQFYTSDYDLSGFTSFKTGIGIRYAPFNAQHYITFKEVELRYAYYKRSDGLQAHMITTYFSFGSQRKRK
ncbi:MAG TPA: DUF3570 domain-containing protein [Chryseolinea sp.]|nr:DUF3570 domain-containing protein [Chryseolinea sp.]HPH45450.1 DUF3570 domain-containing protein [Chryseolinea sp.]HPM29362.1 DUF3570 domain-containing protein [Chryseolinea sp.]